MSALPPKPMRAMREAPAAGYPAAHADALAARWDTLHAQAEQLAHLAMISPEQAPAARMALVSMLGEAEEWQRELVQRAIEDIDAMMSQGLTALATVTERGQDASVPALALWREFHQAREAVVAVARPYESDAA